MGTAQYGAAKSALIFVTERLALEMVKFNVRVNTVSPGSIQPHEGMGVVQGGESGGLRPVRAGRVSDGSVGEPGGGGGRYCLHVVAQVELDQRSEHSGGRTGAARRGWRRRRPW